MSQEALEQGVGPMVRIVSPFPDAAHADQGYTRSERLYYDGVRRIQEVVTDPILNLGKAIDEGKEGAIDAKDENPKLDDNGNPIGSEKDQLFEIYLEREYIWGPGDNGVDELLVQFDRERHATWPVTDAGGDIVALCDMNGPIPPGGSTGTAPVVGEWVYDAYGEPIFASNPYAHAVLKCGHKGLFFDRLDAGVYDFTTGGEMERLVPDARGLYYARNRHHKPDWGRWLQQDPNATGLPVQAGLAFHGEMLGVGIQGFNLHVGIARGSVLYSAAAPAPIAAKETPPWTF